MVCPKTQWFDDRFPFVIHRITRFYIPSYHQDGGRSMSYSYPVQSSWNGSIFSLLVISWLGSSRSSWFRQALAGDSTMDIPRLFGDPRRSMRQTKSCITFHLCWLALSHFVAAWYLQQVWILENSLFDSRKILSLFVHLQHWFERRIRSNGFFKFNRQAVSQASWMSYYNRGTRCFIGKDGGFIHSFILWYSRSSIVTSSVWKWLKTCIGNEISVGHLGSIVGWTN